MGDAVGLGLLSFVFSPPAQMDRSALLAWISKDLAADKDQAALVLSEMFLDASEKTLKYEGIDYRVEKAHQERLALFYPFLETSLVFEMQGKSLWRERPGVQDVNSWSEAHATFIGKGGSAYGFLAGHEIQYPAITARVMYRVSSVGYGSSHTTPFANLGSSGLNMPVRMLIRTRLHSDC